MANNVNARSNTRLRILGLDMILLHRLEISVAHFSSVTRRFGNPRLPGGGLGLEMRTSPSSSSISNSPSSNGIVLDILEGYLYPAFGKAQDC